MKLTCSAFADGEKMPTEFAKLGANRIPPLEIAGVPSEAKSLAIIVHDPDAPMPGGFYHWTLWNIPPETTSIGADNVPANTVIFFTCMRSTQRSTFRPAARLRN